MAQQMWNGYTNQPQQQWFGDQTLNEQWTWYRQYPEAQQMDTPSSRHMRLTEQILHLTRENQHLLHEIHRMMHHQGGAHHFGTTGSDTISFRAPDMPESGNREQPSTATSKPESPSKPLK